MDRVESWQNTSIGRWILANQSAENFAEALKTLVSYACAEWFRRCSGVSLTPIEALSRVVLSPPQGSPLGNWLDAPSEHCAEIADFCEKIKVLPLPGAMQVQVPSFLDLRGVECPRNAARSRLVMAGYPADKPLEIWLDDGSPIENVPGALVADGHKVLFREKKGTFWVLKVVKPAQKE